VGNTSRLDFMGGQAVCTILRFADSSNGERRHIKMLPKCLSWRHVRMLPLLAGTQSIAQDVNFGLEFNHLQFGMNRTQLALVF
jgi:hypothetical protein